MAPARYFFAASVLIELAAMGLWLWGVEGSEGLLWTLASMFVLQVSLLYNSGFRLFKKKGTDHEEIV